MVIPTSPIAFPKNCTIYFQKDRALVAEDVSCCVPQGPRDPADHPEEMAGPGARASCSQRGPSEVIFVPSKVLENASQVRSKRHQTVVLSNFVPRKLT